MSEFDLWWTEQEGRSLRGQRLGEEFSTKVPMRGPQDYLVLWDFMRIAFDAGHEKGWDAATEELLLKKIIFTTDENGCISGFKKE